VPKQACACCMCISRSRTPGIEACLPFDNCLALMGIICCCFHRDRDMAPSSAHANDDGALVPLAGRRAYIHDMAQVLGHAPQVQGAGPWPGLQVQWQQPDDNHPSGKPAEMIHFALEYLQQSMCDLAAAMEYSDPVVLETLLKVEGLMRRLEPARGPVITVLLNMEREMVEFRKISGDQVCGGVPLSEAPCTDPWDFLQFKPFMKEVIARVPWGDGMLDVKHVLDDNGQQLGDAADITGLTHLTIQSMVVFPEALALSDAARIEHCFRTLHSHEHSLARPHGFTNVHKKCQRDSRDLLATMAWNRDRDTYLMNLCGAYEGWDSSWDHDVRAQMLLAYHKMAR